MDGIPTTITMYHVCLLFFSSDQDNAKHIIVKFLTNENVR